MAGKLTPKQALFVGEYLVDRNATRAAQAAGFAAGSAHVTGARLLKKKIIAAAIAERVGRIEARLEVSAHRVVRELAKLAFYDPLDLFDANGCPKPVAEMDEIMRAAITALEIETRDNKGERSVLRKIRLADKGQNLERLGKYLKLFGDGAFGATVETGHGGLPADSTIKIVLVRPA